MFFPVLGALLGLFAGGLQGLIIGALLGYAIGWGLQRSVVGTLQVAQSEFLDATFSVMGALCKADNVVTRDEINAVERAFDQLRLAPEQREAAKAAFNRGKAADFDLDAAVDRFAALSRGQGPLLQMFLQFQFMAVAADGNLHPAEHAMLLRIARRLGMSERDVAQLEALLRAGGTAGGGRGNGPAPQQQLDDAYAALGVSASASDAEVKRAYRKLISENHPDKLAARGLPESMRAVANEKSRQFNRAYDLVKEARQLN